MRLVHYLLLTLFHLAVFHSWSRGDEPRFEVVNRMTEAPAFTVVNRLPAEPFATLQKVALAPSAPVYPEGFRDNWPGVGIVEYRGGAWRAVPPTPSQYHQPAAPAVAARPFRAGLRYDPDHQCDNCGASQYYISGRGPGGAHTHRCGRCGQSWYHRRRVPKRLRVKLN